MCREFLFLGMILGALCPAIVCQETDVVKPIAVRHFAVPFYPPGAWIARVQGPVNLELNINPNGTVESVHVKSGHPFLLAGLEKTFKEWSFETTSAPVTLGITLTFDLSGPCPNVPATDKREPNYYTATRVSAELPSKVLVSTCPPMVVVSNDSTQH